MCERIYTVYEQTEPGYLFHCDLERPTSISRLLSLDEGVIAKFALRRFADIIITYLTLKKRLRL